jgi:hypothetical protein
MATGFIPPFRLADNATLRERLENRSIPEPNSGCILWMGADGGSDHSRHGVMTWKGRTRKAHRLAWEDTHGPIPPGLKVCHKCDVPQCINVAHLFLGTHAENMADMKAKGRQRFFQGVEHPNAKLTVQNVQAIRADTRSDEVVARDFKVSKALVYAVRARRNWRHV